MNNSDYMKNKKLFFDLLSYIIPMVLIIPLSIVGISQMEKSAYNCFFVIGSSMDPTLSGDNNNSTYGFSDGSERAINNIERFDLVVCYYPFENSYDYTKPYQKGKSELTQKATLKVKRVIGLPGDTLNINNEVFSIKYKKGKEIVTDTYGGDNLPVPFERKGPIENRVAEFVTLGEDEYFVMGDNWTKNGSMDSCNPSFDSEWKCIYKENISGVIIKLEGTCTYGVTKHCADCKNKVDENKNKCKCGSTNFMYYDDIIDKTPYEDGPQFLK